MNTDKIRNFCIIAHIDHGKSTLADRMLEITGTVTKREMKSQLLDSMELEREKGITIKLTPVCMSYKGYTLNLIDTPGHVDFSYEVSRSLQAVEGAILVVDATQGIQAQTLANVYLALEQDLTIIPVINKIDLPASDVPRVSAEIINLLGCSEDEIIKVSAKTGEHVDEVLDAIIDRIPAPRHSAGETKEVAEKNSDSMRALIFDSYFDDYRGVILYIRMFSGTLSKNANIHMMATGSNDIALEVGILNPKMSPRDELKAGEIGYIVTNLKATREAKVGDTVTLTKNQTKLALPGYKNVHPFPLSPPLNCLHNFPHQPQEKFLKQKADQNDHDGPGKHIRRRQIDFGQIQLLADGTAGNADHLRSDAGFPAHSQRDPASAYEVGHQRRQVNKTDSARQIEGKYLRHLQKLFVRTLQTGDGIDIDHGEYHQKGDQYGQVFRADPD